MKALGWTAAVLFSVAAGVMAVIVDRILGPDNANPPRGVRFDALWLLYHAGPCLALASMVVWATRRKPRAAVLGVVTAAALIIPPGIVVAWGEAESPPEGFSPTYGLATAATVAVQYLLVLITGGVVYFNGRASNRQGNPHPARLPD